MLRMNCATKILAVVPARGGSKGIPRKNVKLLAGKPLIAWTIEAAIASPMLARVIVSTDDEQIASVAREYGADVPFLRPAELARDDTPGIDPVLHALERLPSYDAVILLQPTSPLRTTADIEGCIRFARNLGAPAAVSISESPKHPHWMYHVGPEERLQPLIDAPLPGRRQDLSPIYAMNGAIYFADTEWLRRQRTFVTRETAGYVLPVERAIDLDTLFDWRVAELLLRGDS